jgi:hypothetical protein
MDGEESRGRTGASGLFYFFSFLKGPAPVHQGFLRIALWTTSVALPTLGEMKILEELLLNLKDAMRFWATGPSHFIDMRQNNRRRVEAVKLIRRSPVPWNLIRVTQGKP